MKTALNKNVLLGQAALLAIFTMLPSVSAQTYQQIGTADVLPAAQQIGQAVQQWIPPVSPQVFPQPTPSNRYYFGMNVQLTASHNGSLLRIVSVTPGSPAAAAGLEVGDEIHSVNNGRFSHMNDSFQAVRRMNSLVTQEPIYSNPYPGGPAPAAASAAVGTYVSPVNPVVRSVARMLVRNVRNGQMLQIPVYPTVQHQVMPFPLPAPAAASSVR